VAPSTALITGASSGIGAELALLCAAAGHNVILVARSETRLEKLATRLRTEHRIEARVLAADLADPASPDAIFAATAGEPIDILINNAGFGIVGAFAESGWTAQAGSGRRTRSRSR